MSEEKVVKVAEERKKRTTSLRKGHLLCEFETVFFFSCHREVSLGDPINRERAHCALTTSKDHSVCKCCKDGEPQILCTLQTFIKVRQNNPPVCASRIAHQ